MPIKSYIIYPLPGKREALETSLKELPDCEVIPSENTDVLILITDTRTDAEDKALEARLIKLKTLQSLTLVAGFE